MTTTVTVAATYDGIQDNGNPDTPPFTVTDFDDLFTEVGGAGADTFSDDSDSTYLTNEGNIVATYENLWRWPRISFPAIDIPSTARYPGSAARPGVAWRITYRARLSSSNPSGVTVDATEPGFFFNDPAYNTGGLTVVSPTTTSTSSSFSDLLVQYADGVDWWSPDIPADYAGTVDYDSAYLRVDAFRDGAAVFYIYPTYLAHLDISEISLTLSWQAAAYAPPLRQYPRDDGLGTSTGLRTWPPPRSVQRGTRRAGHTYP